MVDSSKDKQQQEFNRKFILVFLAIGLVLTSVVVLKLVPLKYGKPRFQTEQSYTIYKNGSYYYAKSDHGSIEWSNTNVTKVWEKVRDNGLTNCRTWMEKVVFKGNFETDSPIQLTNTNSNYTILQIEGRISASNNMDYNLIECIGVSHIEIFGGELDGNREGNSLSEGDETQHGIRLDNCSSVNIHDTIIHGILKEGIKLYYGNDHVTIQNITGYNIRGYAIQAYYTNYHVTIDSNSIKGAEHHGICSWGDTNYENYYVVISNNYIESGASAGGGIVLRHSHWSIVSGNIIERVIYADGGILVSISKWSIVDGNIIKETDREAIKVVGGQHCTISNNNISNYGLEGDNTYDGIHLTGDTDFTTVKGNVVYDEDATRPRYGINEDHPDCSNNIIEGNTIRGYATGAINITSSTTKVHHNFVTENGGVEPNVSSGNWIWSYINLTLAAILVIVATIVLFKYRKRLKLPSFCVTFSLNVPQLRSSRYILTFQLVLVLLERVLISTWALMDSCSKFHKRPLRSLGLVRSF